ncbi:MAG: excinuclease ABC subunit UvrC [Gammaproteobacteria bacterium]
MVDKPSASDDLFNPRPILRRLPHKPGVYRFLDVEGKILYVGKASDLRKRVSSYFRAGIPGGKTGKLVLRIWDIEVTVTGSEGEALILENNLIKKHRPWFNVLLRDDKSYPYIHLNSQHEYPRLSFYRGRRKIPGRLFGPYPSAGAVRETLNLLQRVFRIRSCEESFFRNRSRPCLQYQIRRCSGPCVGMISAEDYAKDVGYALQFLDGKSGKLVNELADRMDEAAEDLNFELAAVFRDQITRLKSIQQQFGGAERDRGDIDVIGLSEQAGVFCVAVMFVRGGHNLGSRTWVPRATPGTEDGEVLGAFLTQYYSHRPVPAEIVIDREIPDGELIQMALSEQAGRKVQIRWRVRGERARWQDLVAQNARYGVELHIASRSGMQAQLESMQQSLGLAETPRRIECFDISHTAGEATVASCVVFGPEGAIKADYRRFNIADIEPGDDYGAMRQALLRRYTRVKRGEAALPDLLMLDGGKGQLTQAIDVMTELQMEAVEIVAVAKGPSRRPGQESLFLAGRKRPFILPPNSKALRLVQQVRDEAHRFAIAGHRQRRRKTRQRSVLEDVPGLGPKKRSALLKEFGGLQGVSRASADDLSAVNGISNKLARLIFDTLHPES